MQKHIVQYYQIGNLRKNFIMKLIQKIIKINLNKICIGKTFSIIEDILLYLKKEITKSIKQILIGIQDLFRGYTVKSIRESI